MEDNNQTDLEEVIQEVEQEATVQEEAEAPKFETEGDDSVIKVDLSKPPTNETEESDVDNSGVAGVDEDTEPAQVEDEVQQETETQEEPRVLEEVTEEEVEELAEEAVEAIEEAQATGKPLPENIQKLVDFMEDTGGDIEDYVKLNRDTSNLSNTEALREYYKTTKPHLSSDEVDFLIEDRFSYDEDLDDEKDIKRKKLALKEQVAEAKAHLDGQKSKYYEEIKAGSKLTPEQQKAIDFFNRYNKESEQTNKAVKQSSDIFEKKTNNLFNDKFKGFEYNVGEKRYRFNVKDVESVKAKQSDINNLMTKFVDKNKTLSDAAGYHKAIYTAMNADAVAQHFYEQGKADALKESIKKSKNIDMNPRGTHEETKTGGIKVRVLGEDSNSFKFKMKNKR